MHRIARLLSLCLLLSSFGFAAQAATLTVTNNADSGTGSLRAAIAAAAGGDTINFSTDMTITLTSGNTLIPVNNMTIDAGSHSVAVDGNNLTTVLTVNPGVTLQLTGLTIQNGSAIGGTDGGGGIINGGTVNLTNCTLSGNSAGATTYGSGGGINNWGTMTLTNSTLQGNSAAYDGGGIYNGSTLTLINSTLSGNSVSSPFNGVGGGIHNLGTLTVTNSTLSGNSALLGGGIESTGITLTISHSTLSGNSANSGGGLANYGPATLTDDTLSDNSVTLYGGGIINGGTLTLINSALSGNSAPYNGGGIYNDGGATLTLTKSTLSGNSATFYGGGIFNVGTLAPTNSTLTGNSALLGGGIYNGIYGALTLINSTLSGNSTGIYNLDVAKLTNTIIADGCSGTVSDGGGNFDSGTSCGYGAANSNATLNLGPLANNGGSTQTMMPGLGSAAIGAGIDSVCAAAPVNGVDQRAIPRPQGAHCDSGAVEVVVPQILTIGVTGSGTVSADTVPSPQSGGILNCSSAGGTNCSATYATGQSVVLTAVASPGYQITWGGACTIAGSSNHATVPMSAAENCTATFMLLAPTISMSFNPTSTPLGGTHPTLTIIVTNPNSVTLSDVTFSDTLPFGLGWVSQTSGTCATVAGTSGGSTSLDTVTRTYSSTSRFLAAGSSCFVTLEVVGKTLGTFTNTTSPVSATESGAGGTATATLIVTPESTSIAVSSSANPSMFGQDVTFSVTVTGNITPTGTVSLTADGATTLCANVSLSGGQGGCSTSTLGGGNHSIQVSYSGDTYNLASSATYAQVVNKKTTTVSLVVAPNRIALGQSITLTATVAGDPPTGAMTFTDNGNGLLCSPVTLVTGTTSSTAVCTTTPVGTGSHSITAIYSGDGNFAGATSSVAVVRVDSDATPAPMLDRCAILLLSGLFGTVVFVRLRRI